MFRTAVRNVLAHKARLTMTVLAVLLGVAFVSGTLVFSDTVGNAFRLASARNLKDVAVSVLPGDVESDGRTNLDERTADRIRALPGVASVRASVSGSIAVADKDGKALGRTWGSLGANYAPGPAGEDSRYPLAKGRGPAAADEVALDVGSARRGGFKVGDRIKLATDGPVMTKTLVGLVHTDDPRVTTGGSLALFDTATAQRLFTAPGSFSEIVVAAEPGTDQRALTRRVEEVLPDGATARSGASLAEEESRMIAEQTSSISKTLLVFAGIALFVGVFIIANTFSMLVAQRTREVALLRAIGASRRQVVRSVLIEAALLGLVASAAGFAAGLGIAMGLRAVVNAIGSAFPDGPLIVGAEAVLSSFAVGITVTVLAAWLPSRRAARIAPVEALSTAEQPPAARSLLVRNCLGTLICGTGVAVMFYVTTFDSSDGLTVAMAGSALTMAGAVVLAPALSRPLLRLLGAGCTRVFGISGKLAMENTLRDPRRTAATASALMIGLALITGLTVAGYSAQRGIDRMALEDLRADYQVSMANFSGLSPEVARAVAGVPGVEAVAPIRTAYAESGYQLTGTDVAALGKVAGIEFISGSMEAVRDGAIAVSEKTAGQLGWKTGGKAVFRFLQDDDTTAEGSFTVAGVYRDNEVVPDAFGPMGAVTPYLSPVKDSKVLVKAAPGKAEGLGERIKDALGGNPAIKVQSREEIAEEEAGDIATVLAMVYGLLGFAVVIAVLGVVNTLAMSVFERTREIGMLRAIGLTRGGVRRMVRLESVMISLFGAVLGMGLGTFLAWAGGHMLASSFPEYSTVLPWPRFGLFLLIALVVGVLAAVWPARRAARLNTLEAISAQ